jgi:signal transduction histidine kinase
MNLKLRFALLFTSFVAAILLIACTSIYFLYATYREEDYYNRVQDEGNDLYDVYTKLTQKSPLVLEEDVLQVHRLELINESLFILDSSGKLIFKLGREKHNNVPIFNFAEVQKKKFIRFTDLNDQQIVVTFKADEKKYSIITAYDKVGLRKVNTIKLILIGVFGGSLLLTAVMAFLFVQQAIKPIVELSNQMQKTNELNLSERITVRPAKDEINAIARNFNSMLERIRTAFEFRKSFVQHTSHELRTPLAVMLSQTEAALNSNYDAEGYRKVLMSLKEDQQHLIELTNSLLLISQNEQMEFMDEWPLLRIDELLFDTVAYFNKSFPDAKTTMSFETMPSDDLALMVKGNEALLKAALVNLMKNAYLYSEDKSVSIRLITEENKVRIKFQNKGNTLSPEEAEKMMLPFFRGANANKKKGFGLGLAIINRIVQIHKGCLNYKVLSGNVNTFVLELPVMA